VVPAVAQGPFLPCLSRWARQWSSDGKKWRAQTLLSGSKLKNKNNLRAQTEGK
jgi:hypothetical protein